MSQFISFANEFTIIIEFISISKNEICRWKYTHKLYLCDYKKKKIKEPNLKIENYST